MTDRKQALSKIATEILGKDIPPPEAGAPIVVMSGLNGLSRSALMEREWTIRFFPFLIGRISSDTTDVRQGADLAVSDRSPYQISKKHLSLERRENGIYLVDRNSRNGSLVNNILLGEKVGGVAEIPLNHGYNEVVAGGRTSPFMFNMEVVKDKSKSRLHDQVQYGERTIPVVTLYSRLCHQATEILGRPYEDRREVFKKALDLIEIFAPYPETTHLLYFFSASPDTFPDSIVAHSVNVAIYTVKLAYGLRYAPSDIIKLGAAALLHDIGMYDVPAGIVGKREKLSLPEYELIKMHPTSGYNKLSGDHEEFHFIQRAVYEHHERIDGSGYPRGVTSLSEMTELVAMVDYFEALTHYRPQRGPVTPHVGIRMLLDMKRVIFSPKLLKTFIREFSLFPVFSVVQLNTGEIGQVVRTDPDWPLRPTVRIFFQGNGKPLEEDKEINLQENNNIYISKDISDRIFIDSYFQL